VAHNQLGQVYRSLGEWEKALPEYIEAARLDPSWTYTVANQVLMYSYLGRFDEAKAVAARAAARNVDSANIRRALLVAAYGQGDRAGAEREIQWLAGKPEEYQSLRLQAADAAALGQRRRSRQLLQRGAEILEQKNLPEAAASFLAREALVEALDGSCPDSLRLAGAAAKHSQAPGDMVEIALARALCGDAGEALKATEETSRRYPLDTLLIAVHQPSMRAAIELSQKRPEAAIEMLRPAKPYERAYAYAPYLRGIALLRMGKGLEASAEFQKVLDQKAVHWGPYYPLALAGLARASSLAGDPVRARKAYQDLLALWKDADPDLPVLKEVRQEYARLR
jgi:tetratricopeptide (TPR) repeat protein